MDKVIISPTIRPPTKSKALEWALRIIMEIPGTMAAQDPQRTTARRRSGVSFLIAPA
jgi:hypothetical protein